MMENLEIFLNFKILYTSPKWSACQLVVRRARVCVFKRARLLAAKCMHVYVLSMC